MTAPQDESTEAATDRRRLLKYGLLAGVGGLVSIGVALSTLDDGAGADPTPTNRPTTAEAATPTEIEDDVSALVERYAPDLYFGRRERWFPTDPRPYASEQGGETVVDGFDALDGYTRELNAAGAPPQPTVFYNVAPVDGTVIALQYWMYSVFDQFTVNFHWHDWELLQVFLDTETGEVRLLVASAHARKCPNNEYLRPDLGPTDRPVVLSEVGSHSSATDVNERRPSFERLAGDASAPDVTNGGVRPLDGLTDQPFAYGLPRGEGLGLPYVLPELDGVALPDHPDLPQLRLEDFVAEDVIARSWGDLARPPSQLPTRETGPVLTAPTSQTAGTATYDLRPIDIVREWIDDFTGPQLSFEFAIPGFVETLYADHITTVGIPWESPRFSDPTADITDPDHRRAVGGDAPEGLTDTVVGVASMLLGRSDGDLDAVESDDRASIEPYVSVSRFPLPIEVACLLRSDPVAVPTAGGVFRFVHVEPGFHELIVNGPGVAPYAERFEHTGGLTQPGADGRVTLVGNEDAVLLRADRRGTTGIRRVRIEESFVGPVFDGRPVEEDRFAVPVHRDGAYTVEIVDRNGVRGSVRVDPAELQGEPIPAFETGKEPMARTLAADLEEAATQARELADGEVVEEGTVPAEFAAASRDAARAAELAADGEVEAANERLIQVIDRLYNILDLLQNPEDHGYTEAAASLLSHRASTGIDHAERTYGTPIAG
jgi:hypothetical protein